MKISAIASALFLLSVVHGASAEDAAVPAAIPAKSLRQASHIVPAAEPADAEPSDAEDAAGDVEMRWAQKMVAVAEERTKHQCKADCKQKKKDDEDFNKTRCERDCDDMDDKGNSSNNRNMSCSDCKATYKKGSNKYERCMGACGNAQKKCADVNSCSECNKKCSGNALDKCRNKYCGGNNKNKSKKNKKNSKKSNKSKCKCGNYSGDKKEDCKKKRGQFSNCAARARAEAS